MSGETVQSDQPDVNELVTPDDKQIEVNRSPEEYAKRVLELSSENKKRRQQEAMLKQKLNEYESKIKEIEDAELKQSLESGKYKEAYEKKVKELESEKERADKMRSAYAFKVVSSQLESEATKNGCVNTQAMLKIAAADGILQNLDIDEDFRVSSDALKTALSQIQKDNPFLFGKTAPTIKDQVPASPKAVPKKQLTDLSMDELVNMAKELR